MIKIDKLWKTLGYSWLTKEEIEILKNYYNSMEKENNQLKQALLDIKEYIEDNSTNSYLLKTFDVDIIIDIVNKALGDKENENNNI